MQLHQAAVKLPGFGVMGHKIGDVMPMFGLHFHRYRMNKKSEHLTTAECCTPTDKSIVNSDI